MLPFTPAPSPISIASVPTHNRCPFTKRPPAIAFAHDLQPRENQDFRDTLVEDHGGHGLVTLVVYITRSRCPSGVTVVEKATQRPMPLDSKSSTRSPSGMSRCMLQDGSLMESRLARRGEVKIEELLVIEKSKLSMSIVHFIPQH